MARRGSGTFWLALAVAPVLAGCSSGPKSNVTGSHGGLLPGMAAPGSTLTSAQVAKLNAPSNIVQTKDERLPDGRFHRTETLGGALYSETWYSSTGVPQRMVTYSEGAVPLILTDYAPDGRTLRVTTLYPGTAQAQRLDEYDEQGNVVKFTLYWPQGGVHLVSESGVPTPAGPVWRVREWYPNGLQKSVSQKNADGLYEGRQTTWDAAGNLVTDEQFSQGTMVQNYLRK
jgi:hypothetical protein